MNKLTLSSVAVVATLLSSVSAIASDYYVSAQGGASLTSGKLQSENLFNGSAKKSLKNGATFSAIMGMKYSPALATELELVYDQHKFARSYAELDNTGINENVSIKSKVKSYAAFANVNYRFEDLSTMFVPYVSAGVGMASNKTGKITYTSTVAGVSNSFTSKAETSRNFAWQVGVGALVPVNESIAINLSCKYRDLGKVKSNKTLTDATTGTSHDSSSKFLKGNLRTVNVMSVLTFIF